MANTKISQLTATVNPTGNEELVYAYNNANGKMTLDTMKTFVQNNLSGYATTADLAGKQDTLVSGTNIKTINNTSLLGSGDITISGGGGSATYDCVVDAAGTGDYTTLGAAITAGKRNIFIKEGNYNESPITLVDDSLTIVGANAEGVILNYTISTGAYETGGACLTISTSTKTSYTDTLNCFIMGVTFNITENTGDGRFGYVINANGVSTNIKSRIDMYECNIFANQTGNDLNFSDIRTSGKEVLCNITDSTISVHNESYGLGYYGGSGGLTYYKGCMVHAYTNSNNDVYCSLSSTSKHIGCTINVFTTGSGNVQLSLNGAEGCNISVKGVSNDSAILSLSNANGCNVSITKPYNEMQGMTASTEIGVWAANTAYTVGNFVQYGSAIYKCTTAHTSSSEFYNDTSNWDVFKGHAISDVCNCSISRAEVLKVSGVCTGNNIDACYNIFVIGDSEGHNVNANFSNNFTLSNSISLLKVVGQLAVVCGNGLKINYGIRYQDGYHIIKDNVLTSDSNSDYPTVTLVGTNNNNSKVSDNILRYRQDD